MNQVEESGFRGTQIAEEPPKQVEAMALESAQKKQGEPAKPKLLLKDKRLMFLASGLLLTILLLGFSIRNMMRPESKAQISYGPRRTTQPSGKAPNNHQRSPPGTPCSGRRGRAPPASTWPGQGAIFNRPTIAGIGDRNRHGKAAFIRVGVGAGTERAWHPRVGEVGRGAIAPVDRSRPAARAASVGETAQGKSARLNSTEGNKFGGILSDPGTGSRRRI